MHCHTTYRFSYNILSYTRLACYMVFDLRIRVMNLVLLMSRRREEGMAAMVRRNPLPLIR